MTGPLLAIRKNFFINFMVTTLVLESVTACFAETLPKGLMLNLGIQNVQDGLIPNKAFYPLYVPQGDLSIHTLLGEQMLVITPEQGLDIPHSSLIEPDGTEWIVSIKLGAYADGGNGMVMSQGDEEHGYAIYLKDGAPRAVVRTGNCSMTLKEDLSLGVTDCRKQMTSIELRIQSDQARLIVNRVQVASVPLDAPLDGVYMPIRIGNHPEIPPILKNMPDVEAHGFSGAISSLSVWRQ